MLDMILKHPNTNVNIYVFVVVSPLAFCLKNNLLEAAEKLFIHPDIEIFTPKVLLHFISF